MAFLSNLHTHTRFSDGSEGGEAYIKKALELGFDSLGFSEHAYTPYEADYCIRQEETSACRAEFARLKAAYAGQIELYFGWEGDCYHMPSREGTDYIIGSVHNVRDNRTGEYWTIDYLPELFEKAIDACGGVAGLAQAYYSLVAGLAESYRPEIVGHLDLLVKLNKNNCYFDPAAPWYRSIMKETVERLAKTGCIVEVNTGGMTRGYTAQPYPSLDFLRLLYRAGVPVTISSDAHRPENLDACFAQAEEVLLEAGYRTARLLRGGVFTEVAIG